MGVNVLGVAQPMESMSFTPMTIPNGDNSLNAIQITGIKKEGGSIPTITLGINSDSAAVLKAYILAPPGNVLNVTYFTGDSNKTEQRQGFEISLKDKQGNIKTVFAGVDGNMYSNSNFSSKPFSKAEVQTLTKSIQSGDLAYNAQPKNKAMSAFV